MNQYDVTVVYMSVSAESEDRARDQIQPLLNGHFAEIESVEEIE